ncbi:MAG: LysR family transcriptional regulator [Deinococcales bacterium]|nr:LysR family transcriptional regulator [Deinococcales bacterium]
MNAEHLRSFCVVAREGSVTAAARTLGLTQPAVSRHLRLLQEERGQALYERRGAGIALTPAGRQLLPYACAVSQALERAEAVLRGRVAPEWTRLRVALSHHLTTRYTGPLLRAARAYNDEGYHLRLHLLEGYTPDLVRGLQDGSLDAAYVLGEVEPAEGITATPVGSERLVLLVRGDDPLAREQGLHLTELDGETLVAPSSASLVYRLLQAALEATGARPGRVLEVSGPAAVRSAVYAGLGIGVTMRSYVETELLEGALRVVEVEAPGLETPVTRLTRNEWFLLPDQQHALAFLAERVRNQEA